MIYNLNKQSLYLNDLPNGKNQNLILKVGKKYYYCDINKNALDSFVEIYDYKKDRKNFSKYNANRKSFFTKSNNFLLSKNIVENINEIIKAINILSKFDGILII